MSNKSGISDQVISLLKGGGAIKGIGETSRMYEWFDEEGYEADISALHKEYPGLTTFEQYLRQSGWSEA